MPIKIHDLVPGDLRTRIDAFRKTIPSGQGYEIEELIPIVKGSASSIRAVIAFQKFGIRFKNASGNDAWLLVNPKDLKKYADKS